MKWYLPCTSGVLVLPSLKVNNVRTVFSLEIHSFAVFAGRILKSGQSGETALVVSGTTVKGKMQRHLVRKLGDACGEV